MILGSGPGAVIARDWSAPPGRALVAINNAWQLRTDWTHNIHPEDFPPERRPERLGPTQRRVEVIKGGLVQAAFGQQSIHALDHRAGDMFQRVLLRGRSRGDGG